MFLSLSLSHSLSLGDIDIHKIRQLAGENEYDEYYDAGLNAVDDSNKQQYSDSSNIINNNNNNNINCGSGESNRSLGKFTVIFIVNTYIYTKTRFIVISLLSFFFSPFQFAHITL